MYRYAWLHLLANLTIATEGLLLGDIKASSSPGWTRPISPASPDSASAAAPGWSQGLAPSAELLPDYQCLSHPKLDTEVYVGPKTQCFGLFS